MIRSCLNDFFVIRKIKLFLVVYYQYFKDSLFRGSVFVYFCLFKKMFHRHS